MFRARHLLLLPMLALTLAGRPASAAEPPADPTNRTNLYFLMKALKARQQPEASPYVTGRQQLLRRLAAIRLPEVRFDGVPLPEVVEYLQAELRRRDPERRGVNFLFVGPAAAPRDLTRPAAANPSATPVTRPPDLESVVINLRQPLRNLTALQVLDVITKTADQPIRFAINDHGITAMPRATGSENVVGRALRANPDTFQQGLQNVNPRPVPVATSGTAGAP